MDEFSLYVLDIVNNSTRAGARRIRILLHEEGEWLFFTVEDDGCGMTDEQVKKLTDPFFTTRTTRKVGLGVPFLAMLAEMTGGNVSITSSSKKEDHGTILTAKFGKNHIDFLPLGDLAGTVVTLIQGAPDTDFFFRHDDAGKDCSVALDTAELRAALGEEISLSEPEVLAWISDNLREQYRIFNHA